MLTLAEPVVSQGVQITSGGKIEATGSATIEITDGNFINSGTFTPGASTVTFNGTALQTITSGGSSFNNAVFNNQKSGHSDINISDPLSITGSTTFTNGILYYSGTGTLTFGLAATSTNGNAGSFVDGQVSKIGTTAFTFPVGDVKSGNAIWAPIAIAAPAVSSTISTEYFLEAPANYNDPDYFCDVAAFDFVSSTEYWTISSTSATPEVTLFWMDGTRSGVQNLADLLVASWEDCSVNKWVNKGGTTTGTTAAGSITITIPMTSFNKVTFASKGGQNTLPVSLLGFSAKCANEGVNLEWSTATEIDNNYFTLERSADLYEWSLVGKVQGAGNSNTMLNYSYLDPYSYSGITYYRLKQTDFNGTSETFEPVAVRCNEINSDISCYPNPFTDQLVISLQHVEGAEGEIRLIDVTGRIVMHQGLISSELMQNTIELTIPDIAEGVYSLEFRSGSIVKTVRVVKSK
ncbi:MAG: hypothetical protein A2W93_05635 [Bacteroidetes bacterium GWF2_43_63]|nr:MAG: hypothetical protein A2W93_05635 [Bacteroidetes bacterium GWF2_43_63]